MASPKNVDVYSWRNKEGLRAVLNCYNGAFKMCIFAPRKGNAPPAGPIEYFTISDTDFFSRIRHEAEKLWTADIGTTFSCLIFKIDQVSRQQQPLFILTLSKENNPDYLYSMSLNFAGGSKKEYAFPFESNKFITLTSGTENKVQQSADKFKDFITVLSPGNIVTFKATSIGDKVSNGGSDNGKASFTSTAAPVEDDIPI